jgi:hypothetical protein
MKKPNSKMTLEKRLREYEEKKEMINEIENKYKANTQQHTTNNSGNKGPNRGRVGGVQESARG